MAKFCGKCGTPLDPITGLCQNCSRQQTSQQQSSTHKKGKQRKPVGKQKTKQAGTSVRKFFIKLTMWLLVWVLLAAGIAVLLEFYNVVDIPFVEELGESIDNLLGKTPEKQNDALDVSGKEEIHATDHIHVWEDATCTAARQCSICGEISGDAIEHKWEDATCTTSRHCSSCGIIDGDALGHQWKEATYGSPKTCEVCQIIEGEAKTLKKGDIIIFGTYEQDADEDTQDEPLEWIVLDVRGNNALIITKECIDTLPFHDKRDVEVEWKDCRLRDWLNSTVSKGGFPFDDDKIESYIPKDKFDGRSGFLTNFTSEEQGIIEERLIDGSTDRVFLLSKTEVQNYFDPESSTTVTPYALLQGAGVHDVSGQGYSYWWTRTNGNSNKFVQPVSTREIIIKDGDNVGCVDNTIRPAMWIDFTKLK